MTREERENVLHCLKSIIDEEVCEECNLYGSTGTDHCQYDMVKLAIEALSKPTKTEPTRPRVIDDTLSRKIYDHAETKDIYSLDGTVSTMLVIGVDTVMDIIADYLKGGDSDA